MGEAIATTTFLIIYRWRTYKLRALPHLWSDVLYCPLLFKDFKMKSLSVLLTLATSFGFASAIAVDNDASPLGSSINVPRSDSFSFQPSLLSRSSHKQKDNWGNAIEKDRKKITIRASKDDRDDISDDFLWAIKKANNGGLVHLKKGHKYVIGKKLDLTFLKDVYVKIDGELKVCNTCPLMRSNIANGPQFTNDIKYWQANNFYYDFQKSITFWVWGGK
jgi:galacturan 1,4-alpha-galacturonidase